MKHLPTVTLCAVSSVKIPQTIRALKKSMRGIIYARVILLTDVDIAPIDGIEIIRIKKLGYDEYSRFIVFELKDYITTDFVLLIQHDGYVLRPHKWDDTFLKYDYIGAPWPPNRHFVDGKNIRVGNGGFTLRSKKMLRAPTELGLPFTDNDTGFFHEDGVLCIYHRNALEHYGIRYAPVEVAARFSRERWCHDSVLFPFGFHNGRSITKSFKRIFAKKYD